MKYSLIKDLIRMAEDFETQQSGTYTNDIQGFKQWIFDEMKNKEQTAEPYWEGKEKGRPPESAINTLIVHMNRYAKTYSKSAMHNSDFSTQDEFVYLINLRAFGPMTKMELIKKNIQEKPAGMQIINRLIQQGWIKQQDSETDKRSKILRITNKGLKALDNQMDNIRHATRIVTGNLTHPEKMELIRLLNKLDHFHHAIFVRNIDSSSLLDIVLKEHMPGKN